MNPTPEQLAELRAAIEATEKAVGDQPTCKLDLALGATEIILTIGIPILDRLEELEDAWDRLGEGGKRQIKREDELRAKVSELETERSETNELLIYREKLHCKERDSLLGALRDLNETLGEHQATIVQQRTENKNLTDSADTLSQRLFDADRDIETLRAIIDCGCWNGIWVDCDDMLEGKTVETVCPTCAPLREKISK